MEKGLKVSSYEIFSAKESDSAYAKLLHEELTKRTQKPSAREKTLKILLSVDENLTKDYSIAPSSKTISLKAKNNQKMTWLLYQFVSYLGTLNSDLNTEDLPPPIAHFDRHNSHNFAFHYMEPYLAPNLQNKNHKIFGTNYLESDWGIWGHNLANLLKPDADKEIFARINGQINENQFCFSSEELFRQLSDYVAASASQYFMIMPRDNKLVCVCDRCTAKGNTSSSATPAVSFLVEKIARAFPQKQIFTSSYHTTTIPPANKLPTNTGVMISAIQFPINPGLKGKEEFKKTIHTWKHKVNTVFVWDYISNFDDYLTPVPVVNTLQKRLKFYRSLGVEGVFLNGSGYDFASSQRYKTFILSSLLVNPNANTEDLSRAYFAKHYPISGDVLFRYFRELEADFLKSGRDLNIYGGMQQNIWTYLKPEKFYDFYKTLEQLEPESKIEMDRLSQLMVGLHFTYLQLALINGTEENGWAKKEGKQLVFNKDLFKIIDELEVGSKRHNINVYSESGAKIEDYLTIYRSFIQQETIENILLAPEIKRVEGITPYQNSFLTDGVFGFPTDQHIGWVQIPNSFSIKFNSPEDFAEKNLSANFLVLENYGIYAPQRIEIYRNGALIKTAVPDLKNGPGNSRYAAFNSAITLKKDDDILIKFIQKEKDGTNITAIDELILN